MSDTMDADHFMYCEGLPEVTGGAAGYTVHMDPEGSVFYRTPGSTVGWVCRLLRVGFERMASLQSTDEPRVFRLSYSGCSPHAWKLEDAVKAVESLGYKVAQ